MGTTLAESGDLDSAELMFMKAIQCCDDVKTKGMMNLALTLQTKANNLAASGDLTEAKVAIDRAGKLVYAKIYHTLKLTLSHMHYLVAITLLQSSLLQASWWMKRHHCCLPKLAWVVQHPKKESLQNRPNH